MADTGLFISWGQPVRDRERQAGDQMRASLQYWKRLRENGSIGSYDYAALSRQGGSLWGYAVLRGSAEQIDALRHSPEFGRYVVRLGLVADDVAVIDATVDEELLELGMDLYDETIKAFD